MKDLRFSDSPIAVFDSIGFAFELMKELAQGLVRIH